MTEFGLSLDWVLIREAWIEICNTSVNIVTRFVGIFSQKA